MKSINKNCFFIFIIFFSFQLSARYIFQQPALQAGDNLVALYNAYAYAKKYNLTLAVAPFNHFELFECSRLVQQLPTTISRKPCHNVIEVTREQDIIKNLHKPNVHFFVHVLSERLPIRQASVNEAKKLLMLNKNINFDYLPQKNKELTIAVHIRKGNGGGQVYDGELWSQQIFDFDHTIVNYTLDTTNDPFKYFEAEEKYGSARVQFPHINAVDVHFMTKFPPEQYYIDQINKVVAENNIPTIVKIFTDDKNPLALIERIKNQIDNPLVHFEYYDNRGKGFRTMMAEDLHLISQCDIFIRSTSRFSIVAEAIGNFKAVLFPLRGRWLDKKLIINNVCYRRYTH